jgi:hypothetical protein
MWIPFLIKLGTDYWGLLEKCSFFQRISPTFISTFFVQVGRSLEEIFFFLPIVQHEPVWKMLLFKNNTGEKNPANPFQNFYIRPIYHLFPPFYVFTLISDYSLVIFFIMLLHFYTGTCPFFHIKTSHRYVCQMYKNWRFFYFYYILHFLYQKGGVRKKIHGDSHKKRLKKTLKGLKKSRWGGDFIYFI